MTYYKDVGFRLYKYHPFQGSFNFSQQSDNHQLKSPFPDSYWLQGFSVHIIFRVSTSMAHFLIFLSLDLICSASTDSKLPHNFSSVFLFDQLKRRARFSSLLKHCNLSTFWLHNYTSTLCSIRFGIVVGLF